jgi:hypothetical protein
MLLVQADVSLPTNLYICLPTQLPIYLYRHITYSFHSSKYTIHRHVKHKTVILLKENIRKLVGLEISNDFSNTTDKA